MATYTDANGNVWTYTTSNITALTLGSGQTVITMPTDNGAGQNFYTFTTAVFNGKTTITSVTIPDCYTSIPDSATSGCTALATLVIGNGVLTIGAYACYCTSLTSITIPNNVTSIGSGAVSGCTALTSITIGSGVSSIDMTYGFCTSCPALTEVVVDASNTYYTNDSSDGVLYNYSKTEILKYPANKSGTSFTIISSVTTLRRESMQYTRNLTSLTIPGTVTTIEYGACRSNSTYKKITTITFNEGLTTIGDYAFVEQRSVTTVNNFLPDSVQTIGASVFGYFSTSWNGTVSIGPNVTSIGTSAFSSIDGCSAFNVDADNANYTNVSSDGVIYSKDVTTLLRAPQNKVWTYTMPETVTSLASDAFDGCNVTAISLSSNLTTVNLVSFRNSAIKALELPNSVTSVQYPNAIWQLVRLIYGEGITTIGSYYCGYNMSALRIISFKGNITSISANVNSNTANWRSIEFHQLTAPTSVNANWLANAPAGLRGHAKRDSDFPAPGSTWNGLVMGEYLDEPEHGATGNIMYSSTGLSV